MGRGIRTRGRHTHITKKGVLGQVLRQVTWDVAGALVGQPLDASTINSFDIIIDFAGGLGGFELVDKIKGSNGDDPILFVFRWKNGDVRFEFGGGTNLSSSLEVGLYTNWSLTLIEKHYQC